MGLDFKAVSEAVLRAYATILPTWMGGKRVGDEWVAERRKNGGPGDSWSINLKTGVWSHFASGRKGHDPIGLYAALNNLEQGAACKQIRQQLGMHQSNVPILPSYAPSEPHSEPRPDPIPFDAPEIEPNPRYGQPSGVYRYGDAFVVVRYDFIEDGEPRKIFTQFTWRRGQWVARGYGDHRPLYHVEQLPLHPGARVLVVEGEKCVHLAEPLLSSWVVLTWSGGTGSWRKSDWTPIKGREVVIWPDADDAGRQAAAGLAASLHGLASSVKVLNPNGAAPGWDIGDAIDKENWGTDQIMEWIRGHMGPAIEGASDPSASEAETSAADQVDVPDHVDIPDDINTSSTMVSAASAPSSLVSLAEMGLECNAQQVPFPTVANASKILQMYRNFKGHIWFDDFRGAIYHTLRSPLPQRWTDAETRALTVRIQQELKLEKFTTHLVQEGLQHAAECNRRNSLTMWLDSLPEWDGVERLEHWLTDCAGVEFNDYTQSIARNWLIAMVARAYRPGCKMDNMPVLEGKSGMSKTSFLERLGGEWYKPLPMEFGSKDFLQALRGAWLVEIPDMTGFGRVAHSSILATLTIRNDTYRAPYAREPQEYARTCVFAATSETDDYLLDLRGKRRYWPVRCTEINLDALEASREKLFAEAIFRYRRGDTWHEVPSSADSEQSDRAADEPWQEIVLETAERWWQRAIESGVGADDITAKNILSQALQIEVGKLTSADCRRVSAILQSNGWHKRREKWGIRWKKNPV